MNNNLKLNHYKMKKILEIIELSERSNAVVTLIFKERELSEMTAFAKQENLKIEPAPEVGRRMSIFLRKGNATILIYSKELKKEVKKTLAETIMENYKDNPELTTSCLGFAIVDAARKEIANK